MPELPKQVQTLLAQFGLSQESVQTVRFGGIVGKVALIALGGFVAVIGTSKYTAGLTQIISIIAVLLAMALIIRWIFSYAEKHPESATLEGAEIILWQQQVMLAAKNMSPPRESPIIPGPEGMPPQLDPPQGEDQ